VIVLLLPFCISVAFGVVHSPFLLVFPEGRGRASCGAVGTQFPPLFALSYAAEVRVSHNPLAKSINLSSTEFIGGEKGKMAAGRNGAREKGNATEGQDDTGSAPLWQSRVGFWFFFFFWCLMVSRYTVGVTVRRGARMKKKKRRLRK
jgi:hypothetical protein